ncbi:OmpA family protein [Hirschia litorea]|uniref:OmpA family protein n=1 Tax=Hirschia litorea TaxID=1199156 RepID=A0ABW2IJD1_9PROT
MSDLGFNKIMAAALSTGLAILGLNAASDAFFSKEAPEEPGYLVEVAEVSSGGHGDEPAWVPPTDYGVLLAEADVAKGEKKIAACVSCHKFEAGGANGTGPGLYDVVMRPKATHGGFAYSSALTDMGGVWDYEALDGFLKNPKKYASGTAMNFAGLNKEADRMNVIAYLRTLSASPAPLPAPLPPEALIEPTGDAEHADDAHAETDAAAHDVAAPEEAGHAVEEAAEDAHNAVDGVMEDAGQAVEAVQEAAVAVEPEFKAEIGGVELTGAANGVEAKLLSFIESDAEPCKEAACWYSFDRLTFNTGSAELDMDKSAAQLDNIAQILNAYPSIELKIGGYTDNTGSEEANMTISQARAEAVVAALIADGIAAERLDPEGYGPQHPVASNDTEEGRAQNRRIDVRVRAR